MKIKQILKVSIFLWFINAEAFAKDIVIYFSWADNLDKVPANLDVDTSTSASVLIPGNTEIMADTIIKYLKDADKFAIKVVDTEKYSGIYDLCLQKAADEKAVESYPQLQEYVDVSPYDRIFIGFPNWWNTMPRAINSFIEHNLAAFENKTVIPFVAHGTSGAYKPLSDLKKLLPQNAIVLNGVGIYRDDMYDVDNIIKTHLEKLNLIR